MIVDDYCTYMAILGENERAINYYVFDWEYKCKVLPKRNKGLFEEQSKKMKRNFLKSLEESKRKLEEERLRLEEEQRLKAKSKVCTLF